MCSFLQAGVNFICLVLAGMFLSCCCVVFVFPARGCVSGLTAREVDRKITPLIAERVYLCLGRLFQAACLGRNEVFRNEQA